MVPPQAHQKNNKLAEVAEEGFALLDEFYGRGPKKSGAQARQKNNKLVEVGKEGFALLDELYGHEPKKSRGDKLPATTRGYDHDNDLLAYFFSGRAQARQKNNKLVEVGKEGFALLDELYGREPKNFRGDKLPATTRGYDHDHDLLAYFFSGRATLLYG